MAFAVWPTNIVFNKVAGQPNPPPVKVTVSGILSTQHWTTDDDIQFADTNIGSGKTGPGFFYLTPSHGMDNLPKGTYPPPNSPPRQTRVAIVLDGGQTINVPVSCIVSAPTQKPTTTPTSLNFTRLVGDPPPIPQFLQIGVPTGAKWKLTISGMFTLITASQMSGTGPMLVKITPTKTILPVGSYYSTITVSDNAGSVNVPVKYVAIKANFISVSNSNLAFTKQAGDPNPAALTISLIVAAGAAWTVAQTGLTMAGVTPTSGIGPATLTITPDATMTAATAGNYPELFTVTSGGQTVTVNVVTTVTAPVTGFVTTPYDTIPDFGQNATMVTIATGNWDAPTTWDLNRAPIAGDILGIRNTHTVTYNVNSTSIMNTVQVRSGGTLTFRTDMTTKLIATNVMVLNGGTMNVGVPGTPIASGFTATIRIANTALNLSADPSQYGTGFIVLGKLQICGVTKTSFLRVTNEPLIGVTSLPLASTPTAWAVGDAIYIPDTRELTAPESNPSVDQWEEKSITAISGATVTTTAMVYDHECARDTTGTVRYRPHVANFTRNVIIESESASGTRGHCFFTYRADVDIRYAAFINLGRSFTLPDADEDNTTYDGGGNVTHIGTNQGDRIAVNFIHCFGPVIAPSNGYQFTFIGNSVYNPGAESSPNPAWGIYIENSSYGLVQGNVVSNFGGACIAMPGSGDGSSYHNVIDGNFMARPDGDHQRVPDNTGQGCGLWYRNPANYIRNNVAVNCSHGWGFSYGYLVDMYQQGNITIPAFQGADMSIPANQVTVNSNNVPLLEFATNECYGATSGGFTMWHLGATDYGWFANGQTSTASNCVLWHHGEVGFYLYPCSRLVLDGFVIIGYEGFLNNPYLSSQGIWGGDYMIDQLIIKNTEIQNHAIGITMPYLQGRTVNYANGSCTVQNCTLACTVNIRVRTPGNVGGSEDIVTNNNHIDGCTFIQPATHPPPEFVTQYNIDMDYSGPAASSGYFPNWIVLDRTLVTDYNGAVGVNFQVYYNEQAGSHIMEQTVPGSPGSPVMGLTNAQNLSTYGITLGGAALPGGVATRALVNGMTLP